MGTTKRHPLIGIQRTAAICFMVLNIAQISTCFSWTAYSSKIAATSTSSRIKSPFSSCSSSSTTKLHAVSKRSTAIFDGSELASIERFLVSSSPKKETSPSPSSNNRFSFGRPSSLSANDRAGYMTIVTGTSEDSPSQRIVGVQVENDDDSVDVISLGGGTKVYRHASATIPQRVSDDDALSTAAACIAVHCASPRIEAIGGDETSALGGADFLSGKVVVLGGGDYARFVADALGTLGAKVYLVSTRGGIRPKSNRVELMGPSVGDDDIGFASAIGDFDSLVDTIGDEARGLSVTESFAGGVVSELKRAHKCERYVSTMTKSQKLILDDGVFFGPGKAKSHEADVTSSTNSNKLRRISPPLGVGTLTLQKLLGENILFPSSGYNKKDNSFVRGWSLKDFWETTSWPRDADAGTNVRYGLPVGDDIAGDDFYMLDDEEDDDMVSVSKKQYFQEEDEDEEEAEKKIEKQKQSNPYVLPIRGIKGLNREIVSEKRDCVLFLSAPYCRTCKSISPQYTRMARLFHKEGEYDDVTFAKADAVGKVGKELGRALDVESVPTFVMFKDGRRYGSALSVSSLPSKKLDLAVEYLSKGKEWDSNVILADEETEQ